MLGGLGYVLHFNSSVKIGQNKAKNNQLLPVKRTIAKMRRLKSYSFTSLNNIQIKGKTSRITIKGDFNKPNRLKITTIFGRKIIKSIFIANKVYIKNPKTNKWQFNSKNKPETLPLDTITLLSQYKSGFLVKKQNDLTAYRLIYKPKIFTKLLINNKLSDKAITKSKTSATLFVDNKNFLKKAVLLVNRVKTPNNQELSLKTLISFSNYNNAKKIKIPSQK